MAKTHRGACFCGAVEVEVSGEPEAMGYCHCTSCRRWSAAPVNAFTLWKSDNVRVVKGTEAVGHIQRSPNSDRRFCTACGGHLMTEHPRWGLTDVFAGVLPGVTFVPGVHVNYAETVLPMNDGLPKMRDFPTELGGSGRLMTE